MKIIIVGAGKIGFAVASQLSCEGHSVTVIEKNAAALNDIVENVEVVAYHGNGVNINVLNDAGVGEGDLFMALTGNDELNLFACLIAKKLGAKNTVARVRQPEYSSAIPLISSDLGLSMAINPERETAAEISRILEFPLANKVEFFARGKVEMIDYTVTAKGPLCGKMIKDVFANMRAALVCTVEREDAVIIPFGDFTFAEGDVMTVISPRGKLGEFFRELGVRPHNIKRVIISGGGRTCFYLAGELINHHVRVSVIEKDEAVAKQLHELLPGVDVTIGDGTAQRVLEENGIDSADAFCCLTGIDEENILSSLYAHHVNPDIKTVTKLNRVELTPIVKPLGIGSVVSPKLITSDRIVSYVRAKQNGVGSGVLTVYSIVDNKAEAIEFEVSEGSSLVGKPIHSLSLKDNVILACIHRAGKIISPRGNDALEVGDTVIVVTTHTGFDILDDIVRS